MGALATAAPAAYHASIPPPDAGPNGWWDAACAEKNFTRWPHNLPVLLYRACGGNATAMAICMEIAQLTHGAIPRRGGGRPEWTPALSTDDVAEKLGVTVRAVQDAINLVVENGIVERRPAKNRAYQYQVRPWAWEKLADSSGKAAQAARPENSEDQAKPPVLRLTDVPLVIMPGKKSRPVPLDDAIRATMRTVSWKNSLDLGVDISTSFAAGELCIEFMRSTKNPSSSVSQVVEIARPPETKVRKSPSSAATGAPGSGTKNSSSSDPAYSALRAGIDERFAWPGALVVPIDDTAFGAVVANLAGSPADLLAYLDTPRQRKRVIAQGYSLIGHIAKDVPIRSTKNASLSRPQVIETVDPSILLDCTNDETAWPAIRAAIGKVVGSTAFDNWFAQSRGEAVSDERTLLVTVPDAATVAVLREDYQELVNRKAAECHLGVERVQFRSGSPVK